MCQYTIEQYFNTAPFSFFDGSLQTLAQMISRCTGERITETNLWNFFLNSSGCCEYCVKISICNRKVMLSICEKSLDDSFEPGEKLHESEFY